jgi:hypothetical protein
VFKIHSQLPRGDSEVRRHIRALAAMAAEHEHKDLFDHLYSCLTILDSKSSSLLSFDSIIIAVFAIFLASSNLTTAEWVAAVIGMACVIVSAMLLLFVVWVHWSTTGDLEDLKNHGSVLLEVRRHRTVRYRLAWYFSVASLLSLIAFLLIDGLPRIM